MAIIDSGSSASGKANVDANFQLNVATNTDPTKTGSMRMFSENDAGTVTLTAKCLSPETSADFRLRAGIDTLMFTDECNALIQNTTKWSHTLNTLSVSSPGTGFTQFSTTQGTTSSHGAFLRTFQYFQLGGTATLWHEERWMQATAALVANEVWSSGFGLPLGAVTLPTDGVWWQFTTAGLMGRICFNGAFTDTAILKAFGTFTVGSTNKFLIGVSSTSVEWWVDDVLLATTPIPAGNGAPWLQGSLPIFRMKHNVGNVANTNTMRVSCTNVTLSDIASSRQWQHTQSIRGLSALVAQDGHTTQGKSQWWTNSTAPTAAAATNTAAIAGATTLGGLVAVLPTLAANSDGILFAYQNPASSININGRNLVITAVKVQGAVSVVLTGGPVVYAYAVAYGHTLVSLATAESGNYVSATAHAPRIAFIGMETYAATAAVGVIGAGASLELASPIVVRPGEFIALIARNLGVVTSAGAITVGCTFSGYWE